VDIHA